MTTAARRVKRREVIWRRVVRGHTASGMSIRAYCTKHRVKEPVFYWWRAELARRDAAKPAATFVPVMLQSPAASDQIEGIAVELRGGRVLRLPAMAVSQVVELVRAIEVAS
jgi:hypothetical protein